jgi:hypothetical protein
MLPMQTTPPFFLKLNEFQVNPVRIASSAFLIIAPFLSWITLSTFGLDEQSTLWDIARFRTAIPISNNLGTASLWSAFLLTLGGLFLTRNVKAGILIASSGLAAFLAESLPVFGWQPSVIPVLISPGIGLPVASVALVLGVLSVAFEARPISFLARRLVTRDGVVKVGLSITALSLTLDGLNHSMQGELLAVLGSGIFENILHGAMLAIVGLLVGAVFLKEAVLTRLKAGSAFSAFLFLVFDGIYHLSIGGVSDFVGHDPTEVFLHVSSYYGIAFVLIGSFVLKRRKGL